MAYSLEKKFQHIQSLRGIIIGRWFLLLGLALLGVIQYFSHIAILPIATERWFGLLAIGAVYNFAYAAYVRRNPSRMREFTIKLVTFLQVIVDQLFFTVIVYATGGVESTAYILYFFPILASTILYADLQIILLAILSIFWYTAVIIAEFNGFVNHIDRPLGMPSVFGNPQVALSNTLSIDMIFLFTALFSVFVNRIIHDRELQITVERDKVRSILNSLEDGIIMLDANKHVLLMNPPARDMLRLYDGSVGPELKKTDFPKSFSKLIQTIREQPEAKRLGQEVMISEGENVTYIQVDSIPVASANGSVGSWIKVIHDITREKQLDEIKSDFISIAAHQLRTPLAALKWFFKIMSDGDAGAVTKKQQSLLDQAFERNNEVIEIVNNLLDISEIEEGRFPYEFTQGDLTELLNVTVKTGNTDGARKHVAVNLHLPQEALPPVEMDKQKLRMALQNIIDNAVKYSPENAQVDVTASLKNGRYFVTVQDHGIGIPKEEQAKIFLKFFRGKNAKEKETTGSGLGLYIVKNVVQKHRGQIWFESVLDQGTTFFLSFPVARSEAAGEI